ncbi:MAG TPA: hypothetical protein PLU30_03665 [Verrucomicrobiae bacterium]|nr:hypothetical protein [Verrucomicrobiae bacterium]
MKILDHAGKIRFTASWSLTPYNRSAKDLVRLAQSLSLHRLDASGTLVPLDLEGMTNTSWTLHQR